jgi:23S rRNA (adenine2503-C2)-methyltransferase
MKPSIYGLTYLELETWCLEHGFKAYHAKNTFRWLYQKRVSSFDMMSDLSLSLRQAYDESFQMEELKELDKQVSQDGTRKYLLQLDDLSMVETVLMIQPYGHSVCISSQIGCNMGCAFCASGLIKKSRDVKADEMVRQLLHVQKDLDKEEKRVSHMVVMGIGEPFDNYDHVMNTIRILNHDLGLAIGSRHMTVSTCGIPSGIRKFAKEPFQVNLAISLHAPNDELRSSIMPINRAFPLKELMSAMNDYFKVSNRKVTYEYILLKDVNDSVAHAKQLASLIKGQHVYVNLIPYNKVEEQPFEQVSPQQAQLFFETLRKAGITATLRMEHGADIDAACGQLRSKKLKGCQV